MATTVLQGLGGVGKSVMALALCQSKKIEECYPDGTVWVEVGRDPKDLPGKLESVGVALGDLPQYYKSLDAASRRLGSILASRSVLIVLDDVWEPKHTEHFLFNAPQCHLLVTSRSLHVAEVLNADLVHLDVLKPSQAIALLRKILGSNLPELAEIARCLSYLPLALRLAGKKLLYSGMSATEWLDRYRERVSKLKSKVNAKDPHENIEVCFDISTEEFEKDYQRTLYHSLGIFPEGEWVHKKVVLKFWQEIAFQERVDVSHHDLEDLIDTLNYLSLIEFDNDSIWLHDLLHDYNRQKLGDERLQYHARLLSAYNSDGKPWYKVQSDDYLYYHLPYHMKNAGQEDELYELLRSATQWMEMNFEQPNLTLEGLIVDVWDQCWQDRPMEAMEFWEKWMQRRIPRSSRDGYTARIIAVRCAFEVKYDEGLAIALCHSDKRIRSAGLSHTYYLSQRESERALSILRSVESHLEESWLIPDLIALQSLFMLVPLMAIDKYQKGEDNGAVVPEVVEVIRDAIQYVSRHSILRILGPVARRRIVSVGVKIILGLLDEAKSSTVNNIGGLRRFFLLPKEAKQRAREALLFLDRSYGSLSEVSDLIIDLFDAGDRISAMIAEFILIAHGTHNPEEAKSILIRMSSHSDPGCVYILAVTHVWYTILVREENLTPTALETAKRFVNHWLYQSSDGYGKVRYNEQIVQYYPLAYYGALWTKIWTGMPDLFVEYARSAEEDFDLQMHIIDTFGDFRQVFGNYQTALSILDPYIESLKSKCGNGVESDKQTQLRSCLVASLGSLRGLKPVPVDAYLDRIQAPVDLVKDIRSYSYRKPTDELYVRFYQLLSDVFVYAPTSFIREMIEIIDEALGADSFSETAAVVTSGLLDLAENGSGDH